MTWRLFSSWILLLIFASTASAQIIERPNNPLLVPQFYGLTSPSPTIEVSPDDRYFVVNSQEDLFIIDTATFDLAQTQPEPLSASTESYGFLPNSDSLFIQQSDSFLTRILVDDPLNDVLNIDLTGEIGTGLGQLVVDPESIDNHLFILTFTDETLYEFNIASRTIVNSAPIPTDVLGVDPTPTSMTYIAFPTTNNQGGEMDQIAMTTNQGIILLFDERTNFIGGVVLGNTATDCPPATMDPFDNILPAAALNTVRNLLFVVNETDNVIHVVDTVNQQEVMDSPICLHQVGPGSIDRDINTNIRDIVLTRVDDPPTLNAPRGFVTGADGVTFLNTSADNFGVIDALPDDDPDLIQSLPLSATPVKITASSQSDGYLYTTNLDNSVSIVSDNPFVTINSVDPDPPDVTAADPDFTINWQVDELCNGCSYRVRANGDIDESGTLLLEQTFTDADMVNTPMVTPPININDFPAGTFNEGENRIFIFSTDAEGFVGRNSVLINVDTPPPSVEITKLEFGNTRAYVTFTRLTEEDIAQYNIYVLQALDQNNPTCPGGLDFAAASPTATIAQPDGGETIRVKITGLTNGVAYCIGVQAEDSGGNVSGTITVATEAVIPEVTAGVAGLSGEFGCSLRRGAASQGASRGSAFGLLLLGGMFWLRLSRKKKMKSLLLGLGFLMMLGFTPKAEAIEVTDQHWTGGFQGGFFLPTNDVLKQLLGTCCNPMFNFSFGRLWDSKYEAQLGVAFMIRNAQAVGINTEAISGDTFNFFVLPVSTSFLYHADFVENQVIVPYVNVGLDYMYFRENLEGDVTKGFKVGYHAGGGIQILLEWFDTVADAMEDYGINDVYLTLEGRWTQIDNFGADGLSFTGIQAYAGILFEF